MWYAIILIFLQVVFAFPHLYQICNWFLLTKRGFRVFGVSPVWQDAKRLAHCLRCFASPHDACNRCYRVAWRVTLVMEHYRTHPFCDENDITYFELLSTSIKCISCVPISASFFLIARKTTVISEYKNKTTMYSTGRVTQSFVNIS